MFGTWNDDARNAMNQGLYEMNIEILAFVFAHYFFSNKNDTPYWQAVRQKQLSDLPPFAQQMISSYYPEPRDFIFFSPQSMFSSVQWWSMLHAGGAYKDYKSKITEQEEKYLKYFIDTQTYKIDKAKEIFPNHYRFLEDWYNTWKE